MAKSKSTTRTRPFTDFALKSLKPKPTRYEVGDPGCPGLRIRVSPGGAITFAWLYREGGKIRRHTIGQFPTTSLAKARKEVITLREKHQGGGSIAPEEDAPRTVEDLAALFYKRRIEPQRKRPDAVLQVLDYDILPKIGKKRLSAVTPAMVNNVIYAAVDRGAATHAGRILAIMKQMFAYGVGIGHMSGSPAAFQKKADLGVIERVKSRALDTDTEGNVLPELRETQALWAALDAAPKLSPQIRHGLRVLLLTGVRSNELRLAMWKHIDLDKGEWVIPVENQKLTKKQAERAKPFKVSLSDLAIKQFECLRDFSDEDCEWVMPGPNGVPINSKAMGKATSRLFDLKDKDGTPLLPIDKFSPHDLRRTLRTHLSGLKVPPHVAEKCLNHSLGRIIQTYDTSDYFDERKEALQRWADRVDLAINPRDNISQLEVSV
ncbi:MAG: tyrosine-type recombinase/integrase [Gammaproteobacteria bacterium]|nr:tyrosine-type recombinase/integrase [Gammaproteobacteria bacterium]